MLGKQAYSKTLWQTQIDAILHISHFPLFPKTLHANPHSDTDHVLHSC